EIEAEGDTICNGGATDIEITSDNIVTDGPILYTWTYTIENDGAITGATINTDGQSIDDNLQEILVNTTPDAQKITYHVTPWAGKDPVSGELRCPGTEIDVEAWIEPTVEIEADDETICDGGTADIEITSDNTVTDGPILYTWTYTIENDGAITGATINTDGQSIDDNLQEILVNTTPDAQKITYHVTPWAGKDPVSGELRCPGTAIDVVVWIEPTLEIAAEDETICDGGTTNIVVSSGNTTTNILGVHYTWEVIDANDAGDVTGYSDKTEASSITETIEQTLTNHTPQAKMITYRITPWALDHNDELYCPGDYIDVVVWIEPSPKVTATPLEQTICNDGITDILLESPNVMTEGVVTFDYTATATGGPGAVTGFTTSDINLGHGHRILDQITNNTNEVQYVTYKIVPRALDTGCADGDTLTVIVAVNPTPELYAHTAETIVCDSSTILIEVNDLLGNVHGEKIYELISTNAGGDVLGVEPSGEYAAGQDINNQLVNLTNEVQEVTYRLRALIKDPAGPGSGYCEDGTDTTIIIQVNPTPLISVTVADTVYCDNSVISFEIDDLNGTVIGDKIYTLTTTYESGQVEGVQPDGEYSRIDFSNTLTNMSNEVQIIYYHFKAHIKDQRGPGTGYCSEGDDFMFAIYLNPTAIVTSDLLNDRDTICNETFAEFELTSPTSVLDGVITFDYVTSFEGDPGDLTGFGITETGLAQGTVISNYLENHTTVPQYVTYTITPHAHSTGCAPGIPIDVVIRVNPSPIDTFYISKEIECHGTYSGSLALETASDSGPYDIRWTGPDGFFSNERNLEDIRFGRYTVRVTDGNNCNDEGSIRLSNAEPIAVNYAAEQVSCHGGSDGSIRITTVREGSGPPYSFEWTGPEDFVFEDNTTRDQNDLAAGQYKVVITDGKGCQYSSTDYDPANILKLSEPDPIVIDIDVTDATCNINDDGSAQSQVEGGTAPYYYHWEGPQGYVFDDNTTADVENLTGGSYTLWVTDSKGCITGKQIEIGALPPFRVTPVITTDYNGYGVSCYGASDASIELEILGDFPPFDFHWSDGSTTRNRENVPAGEYHVQVFDSVNCPSEATVVVTEPDEIIMNVSVEDATCYGYTDGRVYLDVEGGTGNIYYNWEDGQATANAFGLSAGNHFVRVSDINNCTLDTIIHVRQPDPLVAYPVITEPYCDEFDDGSVELNMSGGTSPYRFSWSTGQTTEDLYNIGEGTYYVTVEDFNNCVLVDTIMVDSANELCMRIPNAFTPNDDGHNDYWVIGSRVAGTLGEIYPWAVVEVYNRTGELVYKSQEGYPEPWDGTSRGYELPMDSYFYVIFRNNGQAPISGHVTIIR
ncbi:MAG: PKD-like domain-containing protein, partial [Bacteroidales bacterium]